MATIGTNLGGIDPEKLYRGTLTSWLPVTSTIQLRKYLKLPIFNGFLPYEGHLEFSRAFFLAEVFENVSFDPYNFWITRLPAGKSEEMKNF